MQGGTKRNGTLPRQTQNSRRLCSSIREKTRWVAVRAGQLSTVDFLSRESSSGCCGRRWRIGSIHLLHDLSPGFQVTELPRPAFDLRTIAPCAGHAEDSCDLPEVPIATPFGIVPQLTDDHIFRRGDHDISI